MNIFDKAISVFSPERAVNREIARRKLTVLNSTGYGNSGASTKKKSLLGWIAGGGSAKEDIDLHVNTLRKRSRDLYMGTPIATGALKTARTNVVGEGLKLNAQIDYEILNMSAEEAEAWETNVEREFSLWADSVDCDAQRLNNFHEIQQLAFLSQLMSGDCFVALPITKRPGMPYDLRVQLVEADRICTPDDKKFDDSIINGVEIGRYGEIVAYHVAQFHPLSKNISDKRWVRVEKFGKNTGRPNILHLMNSERPEQTRGVPLLSPVIEALKNLGRYTEAELMAAVVSGMFTVFIKTNDDSENPLGGASLPLEDQVDAYDENSYELGNGAIYSLAPNESIEVANPGRPNQAFDGFVTSICRQIGTALEIPYELLIKHFTASYSASRAALLEAWKMFRMRRSWFANDFCQPIYEQFLTEAIAKGRINAPGFFDDPIIRKAYCGAEWNGPSPGQLDPVKEANAAVIRVENGFSTRAKETVELTSGDFNRNIRQLAIEEKRMREAGLAKAGDLSVKNKNQQTEDDENDN